MSESGDTDEEILMLGLAAALCQQKEKKRRVRRFYVRPINSSRLVNGQYHTLIQEMVSIDEESYFNYFRMTKEQFAVLLDKIGPNLLHALTHKTPISPAERLALTLRYLASGDSAKSLAYNYRLGYSTVVKIVNETCRVIWNDMQAEVLAMPKLDEWKEIAEAYWSEWDFPVCLGAVDGKHVTIQAPRNAGSAFYSYKHSHSIVLLAVADANYRFVYVDIGAFGRQSDGGVFSRASLGKALKAEGNVLSLPEDGQLPGVGQSFPFVFVGDAAFPLGHRLMKPFVGEQLSVEKRIFNYRLSRARRCIENAFGILAARWRIFRRPIPAEPQNATEIVKAAVVLHNFVMGTRRELYAAPSFVDGEIDGSVQCGGWREVVANDNCLVALSQRSENDSTVGSFLRDRLVTYFVSEAGRARVPWQEDVARRGS